MEHCSPLSLPPSLSFFLPPSFPFHNVGSCSRITKSLVRESLFPTIWHNRTLFSQLTGEYFLLPVQMGKQSPAVGFYSTEDTSSPVIRTRWRTDTNLSKVFKHSVYKVHCKCSLHPSRYSPCTLAGKESQGVSPSRAMVVLDWASQPSRLLRGSTAVMLWLFVSNVPPANVIIGLKCLRWRCWFILESLWGKNIISLRMKNILTR